MAEKSVPIDELRYSQPDLCKVVGIPMTTGNNLIHIRAIRLPDVGGRRLRKARVFSPIIIFEALIVMELKRALGTSPTRSGAIARKITSNVSWMHSVARDLESHRKRDFFAIVFWSDECRDWDAWVVSRSGEDVLPIDLKAIEAQREPRVIERPIMVLPVSKYFAKVLKACQALMDASSKRRRS